MAKDWTSEIRTQAQRLLEIARGLLASKQQFGTGPNGWWGVPKEEALAWDTRVRTLLGRIYLPGEYLTAFKSGCHFAYQVNDMERGLPALVALIADIDDGHLPSVDAKARGETLGDLLDQADERLADSETVAAVMLAGGVLEAHLRHVGERRGVAISGSSAIGKWGDALNAASVIDRPTKNAIGGWANLRNDADHLKVREFDPAVVRAMLVGVRSLLVSLPE